MLIQCKLKNLNDTKKLASILADHASKSDVFLLKGDLGAGKTTFAQHFISHITGTKNVPSPTFNLVNIYTGPNCNIWHYDLYRLKHTEELFELGIEESLANGISVIEWPQLAESIIHKNKITIYLESESDSDVRLAKLEPSGRFLSDTEANWIQELQNEFN